MVVLCLSASLGARRSFPFLVGIAAHPPHHQRERESACTACVCVRMRAERESLGPLGVPLLPCCFALQDLICVLFAPLFACERRFTGRQSHDSRLTTHECWPNFSSPALLVATCDQRRPFASIIIIHRCVDPTSHDSLFFGLSATQKSGLPL